ncbi:MAG: autotransporter domain-containing protein [Achromobacter sp.]
MNNHLYRIIFNRSLGVWQVVSDTARSRTCGAGRPRRRVMRATIVLGAATLAMAAAAPGWAADNLPINPTFLEGTAFFPLTPTSMSINVTTPGVAATAIQWASFDVAQSYALNIVQPTAGTLLLNTVGGNQASVLAGTIQGSAMLAVSNVYGLRVQPTGTITGAQAVLLTSLGLMAPPATTLQLTDVPSQAGVSNAGTITASGSVDLSGPTVSNETGGQITANRITLISGSTLFADSAGSTPSAFDISAPLTTSSGAAGATPKVLNAGTLTATNGNVLLQASTARTQASLTTPVISNTGTIAAQNITLAAQGGSIASSGTLDAAGGTLSLQSDMDIRVTGRLTANALTASSTGDLALTGNNQINLLNAIQVGGNFSLSSERSLFQLDAMQVTGTTAIDAGSHNLFLTNAGNRFGGAVSLAGHNVTLQSSGALTVARLDATNDASLTAAGALTISGNVDAASLALSAGSDTLVTGDVAVTNNVSTSLGALRIGAGGTTGSVSGNIANNSSVVFNRSDAVTYGGVISGTGAVVKEGAGVLTLNGVNTYGGITEVRAGTLLVGGTLANASARLPGVVQVRNGARLGGYGTVGLTSVQAGGTLVSGGANGVTGPLTINGDLIMQTGSTLQFGLGAPNSTSALQVSGDVSVGNVTMRITDTGGYATGLYTLIEYGGTLGGNFAALALPSGSAVIIQDPAQRRVSLSAQGVNPLHYWNANGLAGPGQFGGGSGVWSTTSPVWANANGSATGAMFPQPGMAIFVGTPGTVIVDGTPGAVQATALQFASDGYRLVGDRLTLTSGAAPAGPVEVRVGDGSHRSGSYTATVDNVLAGVSGMAKTGGGTLVLNGANTYSGGTWVQGGTLSVSDDRNLGAAGQAVTLDGGALRISGSSLQALPRAIVLGAAGGGLDIADAGNAFTVSNALTGPGSLAKLGAGTLVLNGANHYTGGTSIAAGTLVAARDGALGSGPVNNAATLVFQNDASAAALAISNSGTVDFSGSGGPAGDARLSAGSIAGSGRYALGGNTLTVGANNASTEVAGVIADGGLAGGTGAALVKLGTGTLTLSGINTYTGSTTLTGGVLRVTGSIAASSGVQVGSGATLTGTGVVGATTVLAGGVLAPGNTTATLSVAGDLTMQPGSIYQVQADSASTSSSRVTVAGRANLLGGSVLHAGPDGNFAPYSTYTVLTAAGGVNGRFDEVSSNYAFLTPSLAYGVNDVTLTLRRRESDVGPGTGPIRFADAAHSGNQRAVANALDSLPASNPLHQRILVLPEGAPPAVFDNLSGDAHASIGSALYSGAATVRATPFKYLRAGLAAPRLPGAPTAQAGISDAAPPLGAMPGTGALPAWAEIIGNWQTLRGDGNAATTTQRTGGLFVGADHAIGNGWRLGAALGYTDSNIEVDGRSAKSDVSAYSAALYGGKAFDAGSAKVNLLMGGAYTWNAISTRRAVNTAGMDQTLKADYGASTSQLFAEIGYARPAGGGVTLEPFAGLAWTDTRTRGFSESGGDAALSGNAKREDQTSTTLGLRAQTELALGSVQGRARASLGWRHAFGDVNPVSTLAFQAGQAFTVAGLPIARDAALVELGADVMLSRNANLGLSYGGQFGGGNREISASVLLSWRY